MLDLNDVALFVHVVRAGSFAAAARRLGMPPNTASRRVQALELQLGVRLMQRSTRKLTLTDAGRSFFGRCAEQVDALAQSAQELTDGSQLPRGSVRVAAQADFFSFFRMDWIAEFLAAHPLIRLEFVLSDARADLIGEGIDVAFRSGKVLEPTLVARQIGTGGASLVASAAYLAAHGTPDTLAALSAHDCITAVQPTGRTTWRLDGPEGMQEIAVSGRFGANTAQGQLQATLAGLGIALLPTIMTAPHIRAGALTDVLPDYGVHGIGVYFVFLSSKQLPRAVRAFIDFTMEKMQAQDWIQPPLAGNEPVP